MRGSTVRPAYGHQRTFPGEIFSGRGYKKIWSQEGFEVTQNKYYDMEYDMEYGIWWDGYI